MFNPCLWPSPTRTPPAVAVTDSPSAPTTETPLPGTIDSTPGVQRLRGRGPSIDGSGNGLRARSPSQLPSCDAGLQQEAVPLLPEDAAGSPDESMSVMTVAEARAHQLLFSGASHAEQTAEQRLKALSPPVTTAEECFELQAALEALALRPEVAGESYRQLSEALAQIFCSLEASNPPQPSQGRTAVAPERIAARYLEILDDARSNYIEVSYAIDVFRTIRPEDWQDIQAGPAPDIAPGRASFFMALQTVLGALRDGSAVPAAIERARAQHGQITEQEVIDLQQFAEVASQVRTAH